MSTMKGLVYSGPGQIDWKDIPLPVIEKETDVIGKVLATTICGSDLHILKGDVPETTAVAEQNKPNGIVLGHEAVIKITEVGEDVKKFKIGDTVLVSCITSCGHCYYCKHDLQAHCKTGGWVFGHEINGTQAEYLRVPYGDYGLYLAPENVPIDSLLMLSDAMPTSYEIGVLAGEVKKGDNVAVIGVGPVGLGAILTAKTLEPAKLIAIDMDDTRLDMAKKFGATHTINSSNSNVVDKINELTKSSEKKPGVDTAIECVGIPSTFELCQKIISPGGRIANVGVHGKPVQLELQDLWIKNIKISTGLVSTYSTQDLLKKVQSRVLDPSLMITHRMKLNELKLGYQIFGKAAVNKAVKMLFTA